MSTTRKIEGFAYHDGWNTYGENTLYRDASGLDNEPSEVPGTLIIGGKGYTESEVLALVRDLMHSQDSADTANGILNAVCDWSGILNKHGIKLP